MLRDHPVHQGRQESLKDSTGAVLEYVFSVPGCPPMRPEPGFIEFVSIHFLLHPFPHRAPRIGPPTFLMSLPAGEPHPL